MVLKNSLLAYFYIVMAIFGAWDFVVNQERKLIRQKWMKIYQKFITLLFFISLSFSCYAFAKFSPKNVGYPPLIVIMWIVEYGSLLAMTSLFYYTILTNKASMMRLINEGIQIFKDIGQVQNVIASEADKNEDEKTFKLFLTKLIIDHIVLIMEIIICYKREFKAIYEDFLTVSSYTMNFLSYSITNSFVFILILIQWRFRQINRNMIVDIMQEDTLKFSQDTQLHRKLKTFFEDIVRIFSKICIANFLFSFATTLSGVS